jgi:hypothetical protein
MDYQSGLKNFKPVHDFFIGVDSDGCVFDTMEVKQKEFFIPNALKHFNLFPFQKPAGDMGIKIYILFTGEKQIYVNWFLTSRRRENKE